MGDRGLDHEGGAYLLYVQLTRMRGTPAYAAATGARIWILALP